MADPQSADDIRPARQNRHDLGLISLACAVLVGLAGRAYLPETLSGSDAEKIFMMLVDQLTHPVVGGILLAAVLAAIMSTADSQLLVTSSALTEDLYRVIIRPNASEKELVWVSRGTVIAVAAIACVIALKPDSSVLDLVSYAWAGFGATFGPLVLHVALLEAHDPQRGDRRHYRRRRYRAGLETVEWRHVSISMKSCRDSWYPCA